LIVPKRIDIPNHHADLQKSALNHGKPQPRTPTFLKSSPRPSYFTDAYQHLGRFYFHCLGLK
jgi:hypothetical protein